MRLYFFRILAFILDLLSIIIFIFPIYYLSAIYAQKSYNDLDIISSISFQNILIYFGILLFLNKDIVNGKSLFKRILKLQVISLTNEFSLKQLIIRNITLLLLPIEVIFFIIFKKRIGDLIGKTSVIIKSNKVIKTNKNKIGDFLIWIVINICIILILILINNIEM